MKKMRMIRMMSMVILLAGLVGSIFAETLTMTAYYPSPAGVYNNLRINQIQGNLGIGTQNPPSKLYLYDNENRDELAIALNNNKAGATAYSGIAFYQGGSQRARITSGYNSYSLRLEGLGASGFIQFYTNSAEQMRIASNGQIGIGTTSPIGRLDVRPTADSYGLNVQGPSPYTVRAINTNPTANNNPAFAGFFLSQATGGAGATSTGVWGEADGAGCSTNIGGRFNASGASDNFGVYAEGDKNYFEGDVGIGTTNPSFAKLHIVGGGSALNAASLRVESSNPPISAYFSNTRTGGISKYAIQAYATGANGTNYGGYFSASGAPTNYGIYVGGGRARVSCASLWVDQGSYIDCSDIAEVYESGEKMEPGDVVVWNPSANRKLFKSKVAYEDGIAGVYSSAPGVLLGNQDVGGNIGVELGGSETRKVIEEMDAKQMPLALAGRVPVKVNLEGGAIKPGDLLTSSSQPGIAMKATKKGRVLGVALETFNSKEQGKILCVINPHWWDGGEVEALTQTVKRLSDDNESLKLRLDKLEKRLAQK